MKKAIIVSGFPGVGKTTLFNNPPEGINILDSDSSKYPKSSFPQNYITDLLLKKDTCDVLLVSSHKEVRDLLKTNMITYIVVIPSKDLMNKYLDNYIMRGSPESLLLKIVDNWDDWIDEIKSNETNVIELSDDQYLSDVLEKIIEKFKEKENEEN